MHATLEGLLLEPPHSLGYDASVAGLVIRKVRQGDVSCDFS